MQAMTIAHSWPATVSCRPATSPLPRQRHLVTSSLWNVSSSTTPRATRAATATAAATAAEGEGGSAAAPAAPKVAKGNIVKVNRDKYVSSVEFKAVDHPAYFKGLDYIYEARGEILDLRSFPSGDYALIAWAGIPTAPAWLPVYMLEKASKLEYKRV